MIRKTVLMPAVVLAAASVLGFGTAREAADAARQKVKDNQFADAAKLYEEAVKLAETTAERFRIYLHESESLRSRKKHAEALIPARKALFMDHANLTAIKAVYQAYYGHCVREGVKFLEDCIARKKDYKLSDQDLIELWNMHGFGSFLCFDPDRITKASSAIRKLGGKSQGLMATKAEHALKVYKDLENFPKKEKDIVFPQDLIWVAQTNTVQAKDFGWNAQDATEALQKALDSGATTVIVDDMGSPWHITTVFPKSNQKIIFRKGVRILCEEKMKILNKRDQDLFRLRKCRNLMFVGEGDVTIGHYKDVLERRKYCKTYGGNAFGLTECQNIVIKNMTLAECSNDGLCLGGTGYANNNIYVEDVVINSNYRQACSIGTVDGLYFKNVVFSNTFGGEPMCGIDIEPSYEIQPNANIYLFDCTFKGNYCFDLNFSSASYYPVTFYAKRCVFEPNDYGSVNIFPRYIVYMENNVQAPSSLIFEECDFKGYTDRPVIRFQTAPLFAVRIADSRITDVGPGSRRKNRPPASPILFVLDHDFRYYIPDWKPDKFENPIEFDNVRIEGYKDRPPVAFSDQSGCYAVSKLKGSVIHNGKKERMSKFRHKATDMHLVDIKPVDVSTLLPPADPAPAALTNIGLNFYWYRPWYSEPPRYTLIFYGEKGKASAFTLDYKPGSELKGARLEVASPDGGTLDLGELKLGENRFTVQYPATGFYTMTPPMTYTVKDLDNVAFAYQSGYSLEKLVLFLPAKGAYTGYFEMPAGTKQAILKLMAGSVEILNPKGELVEKISQDDYLGYRHITLKPTTGQAEIWSFRALGGRTCIKFFAPLSGVWADAPGHLPRMR